MGLSIINDDEYCFICGAPRPLQTHHCVHGYHRRFADDYGLTVPLCPKCHHKVHNGRSDLDGQLKRIAQSAFESRYDHETWMQHVGRNYLE